MAHAPTARPSPSGARLFFLALASFFLSFFPTGRCLQRWAAWRLACVWPCLRRLALCLASSPAPRHATPRLCAQRWGKMANANFPFAHAPPKRQDPRPHALEPPTHPPNLAGQARRVRVCAPVCVCLLRRAPVLAPPRRVRVSLPSSVLMPSSSNGQGQSDVHPAREIARQAALVSTAESSVYSTPPPRSR